MPNVSTNEYERAARTRKVERMADEAERLIQVSRLSALLSAAEFWAGATEDAWETLEYGAGTRPQKTQDKPASARTRQRVVNALIARARARSRRTALERHLDEVVAL